MTRLLELGLNHNELEVIKECMIASVEGPFFEEEFHILFGAERSELAEIISHWPNVDLKDENTITAIQNSMNNLTGYPHGCNESVWKKYISITPEEVHSVLLNWTKLLEEHNLD